MKLYTFRVATPLGPAMRIGAEQDGHLLDLNTAAALLFRERDEPDWREYADFLVPPDMVRYFSRGGKA